MYRETFVMEEKENITAPAGVEKIQQYHQKTYEQGCRLKKAEVKHCMTLGSFFAYNLA